MLIDEVLSVGDRRFKKKSYAKRRSSFRRHEDRRDRLAQPRHDRRALRRGAWLNDGEMIEMGPTEEVPLRYAEFMDKAEASEKDRPRAAFSFAAGFPHLFPEVVRVVSALLHLAELLRDVRLVAAVRDAEPPVPDLSTSTVHFFSLCRCLCRKAGRTRP